MTFLAIAFIGNTVIFLLVGYAIGRAVKLAAIRRGEPADSTEASMQSLPDAPEIGSKWKHYNGNVYEVFAITNRQPERQDKYPTTISYRNEVNGKEYSRKLTDWHRSMTFLTPAGRAIIAKEQTDGP